MEYFFCYLFFILHLLVGLLDCLFLPIRLCACYFSLLVVVVVIISCSFFVCVWCLKKNLHLFYSLYIIYFFYKPVSFSILLCTVLFHLGSPLSKSNCNCPPFPHLSPTFTLVPTLCKVNSGSGCTVDVKRPRWKRMVSPLESRWVLLGRNGSSLQSSQDLSSFHCRFWWMCVLVFTVELSWEKSCLLGMDKSKSTTVSSESNFSMMESAFMCLPNVRNLLSIQFLLSRCIQLLFLFFFSSLGPVSWSVKFTFFLPDIVWLLDSQQFLIDFMKHNLMLMVPSA